MLAIKPLSILDGVKLGSHASVREAIPQLEERGRWRAPGQRAEVGQLARGIVVVWSCHTT
jgi:hypothetical protein